MSASALTSGRNRVKSDKPCAGVIGSKEQQFKGIKNQAEGHAQKAVGDIKQVAKDASKK